MQETVLQQGMKNAARLRVHLPPYGPITERGAHPAYRKPSGFLPGGSRVVSAWAMHAA